MIKFRRGDTFRRILQLRDPLDNPILPEALYAQLRIGDLSFEFEVEELVDPGEYEIKIENTDRFILGVYDLFVRFEFLGEKSSMPTVKVIVEDGYRDGR